MRLIKICVVLGILAALVVPAGAVGIVSPYTWLTAENWGVGTVYGKASGQPAVVDKPAGEFTEWDGVSPMPNYWVINPPTSDVYGDDSFGLYRMNSMAVGSLKLDGYIEKDPDKDPYWQYGSGATSEIFGVFYGAQDQTVTVFDNDSIQVNSNGFTVELYEIDKSDLPAGYMSQLLAFDPSKRTAANEYDFLDGTIGTPLLKATTTDFVYTSRVGALLVEGEAPFYSTNDTTYGGAWTDGIDDVDHYDFVYPDSDIYISWDTDQHDSWMYHSHDEGSFGVIPEPMTMLAFGVALGAIGGYSRRRRTA